MGTNFSCKGCADRYPGCHAKCEKYIREKAAWEKKKAEMLRQKWIEDQLDRERWRGMNRAARYRGVKKIYFEIKG